MTHCVKNFEEHDINGVVFVLCNFEEHGMVGLCFLTNRNHDTINLGAGRRRTLPNTEAVYCGNLAPN